jgi:hypothetical protein
MTITTIISASVLGLLIGQLSAGIPLGRALHRHQHGTPPPAVANEIPPLPSRLTSPWPHDEAGELLAAWRDQTNA